LLPNRQFSNAGRKPLHTIRRRQSLNTKRTVTLEVLTILWKVINPTNLGPHTSHQHNSPALSQQFAFPKKQQALAAADHGHPLSSTSHLLSSFYH